jgi:thioredoxin reductase
MFDVIIVGGGPAGLSAALILGRCLRTVLLLDNNRPRNGWSDKLSGYLTRDGIPPAGFQELAHAEIRRYETVEFKEDEVEKVRRSGTGFEVSVRSGEVYHSRKLLLATGVLDDIPKLENILNFYGKSVHLCPYCDAWELRGKPIAVYGKANRGSRFALSLRNWTSDLVLCTDGPSGLEPEERALLEKHGIPVREDPIRELKGVGHQLTHIVFQSGEELAREALFFNTPSYIKSKLLEQLECDFSQQEGVVTGKYESTDVPGLFVAGNICRDVQLVIVAAGEGAEAAFGINTALTRESY